MDPNQSQEAVEVGSSGTPAPEDPMDPGEGPSTASSESRRLTRRQAMLRREEGIRLLQRQRDLERPPDETFNQVEHLAKSNGIKLEDWIPKPEEMSKLICERLILLALYNSEKVAKIIAGGFRVNWTQSDTNPKYFLPRYTCSNCRIIFCEPMPIWWDTEVDIWRKMTPTRLDAGSVCYGMMKHMRKCSPGTPIRYTGQPRPRLDPVIRCQQRALHGTGRKRRTNQSVNPESHTSSGDSIPPVLSSSNDDGIFNPDEILQLLGECQPGSSSMDLGEKEGSDGIYLCSSPSFSPPPWTSYY
uniref:Tas n=1 Tax=Simian foamy virus TaxID=11642 RepID=A0A6J3YL36_9RETR|nr:tas [Simian foamy virus]